MRSAAAFVLASPAVAFEVMAGVALFTDDGDRAVMAEAIEQGEADVALTDVRGGERRRSRRAVQGEDVVQPEPHK